MPKFKVGDKIALAKVEYRTVLEIVQASDSGYLIKRHYRPFESCTLAHNVEDIDNNYELVETPEISTAVDPDGFDVDDTESPVNALAKAEERCRALEEALKAIEGGYSADWLLAHDIEPDRYSVPNEKLDRARWNNCRAVARAALEGK